MKWNNKVVCRAFTIFIIMLSSTVFSACGSVNTVPLQKDMSNAQMLITNAQSGDVDEYAPLELRMAQEKLLEAQNALAQEEYTKAQYLTDEALITAELAEEKARTEKTKAIVEELRQSIEILDRELMRVHESHS